MTTHTPHDTTHWTPFVRFFAPGPFAIGMHMLIHPFLWQSQADGESPELGADR